eukprot:540128_1
MGNELSHRLGYFMFQPVDDVSRDVRCRIMAYLLQINVETRANDCQIIHKIIKDIISNPYDAAYQHFDTIILFQKVSNEKIWFKILSLIGFNKSNDEKHLIFDETKLYFLRNNYQDFFSMDTQHKHTITDDKLIDLSQNETIDEQLKTFKRIDKLIGEHYENMGVTNYFNENKNGLFLQYIIEKQLIDQDIPICIQLNNDQTQLFHLYTGFDVQNFPIKPMKTYLNFGDESDDVISDEDDTGKSAVIFYILHCCYKYNKLPTDEMIRNALQQYSSQSQQQYESNKTTDNDMKDEMCGESQSIVSTQSTITENDSKKEAKITCICGKLLTKINDATTLYNGNGAQCDSCNQSGEYNQTFFHCSEASTNIHSGGYDICDSCSNIQQCYLSKCDHLVRFLHSMKTHELNTENINQILNDYFHLLLRHNDNKHFTSIVNELDKCDIDKCAMFVRNHRNRNEQNIEEKSDEPIFDDETDMVYCRIWDKIHCYFYHTYDIGYCLSTDEITMIQNEEHKSSQVNSSLIINQMIINRNKLIAAKAKKRASICNKINPSLNSKHNQLILIDDLKEQQKGKMFSFGYQFEYTNNPYEYSKQDTEENLRTVFKNKKINIGPKYCHLKQEIISNNFVILTMKQFHEEYRKCIIHFNSPHCKANFRPFLYDTGHVDGKFIEEFITIEYLLSLMVYCNYTQLQFSFSKTYRDNEGRDHNNFYYFGKYLKTV